MDNSPPEGGKTEPPRGYAPLHFVSAPQGFALATSAHPTACFPEKKTEQPYRFTHTQNLKPGHGGLWLVGSGSAAHAVAAPP